MNKVKRSGKLLKAAFAVLIREKKLLLFPLIASALAVIVALFFLMPVVLYPTGHAYLSAAHWSALAENLTQGFQPAHHPPSQPILIGKTDPMLIFSGMGGARRFLRSSILSPCFWPLFPMWRSTMKSCRRSTGMPFRSGAVSGSRRRAGARAVVVVVRRAGRLHHQCH